MAEKFKKIWVPLIALVIGALLYATKPMVPQFSSYKDDAHSQKHYNPGGHKCEMKFLNSIQDQTRRLDKIDECTKELEDYRQKTNEFFQQVKSTDATVIQAEVASQQLWMAWFQTFCGFLTLFAAVGAAFYARDAAQQAAFSNNIAQNSQRAWLDIEIKCLPPGLHLSENGSAVIPLSFVVKNFGNTIATDVRLVCHLIESGDFNKSISMAEDSLNFLHQDDIITPGGFILSEYRYHFGGSLEYSHSEVAHIGLAFVVGVRYKTGFESSYWDKFTIRRFILVDGTESPIAKEKFPIAEGNVKIYPIGLPAGKAT